MGNQLVVGAQVRVEHISPDLTQVRLLGTEGRNHFSTFHCKQQRHPHPVAGQESGIGVAVPPQWFGQKRRRVLQKHLMRRLIVALEPLHRACSSSAVPRLPAHLKLSDLIGVARQTLYRCRLQPLGSQTKPETEIHQFDEIVQLLEEAGRLNDVIRTSEHREDVVVKVFSHPETCSKRLLRGLHSTMSLMADQLRIVDETRFRNSDGSTDAPANFLFYSFPTMADDGEATASASSGMLDQSVELNSGVEPKYIYLQRPYVAYALPDRLATRPYLTLTNRLFLAFQLLKAVETLHDVYGVTHGDIKPSNILVQQSGWLVLVDLAPYKPALLPMDRLTLFEYFYDAEDTRVCYVAPEKFVSYTVADDTDDIVGRHPVKKHHGDLVEASNGSAPRRRPQHQPTSSMSSISSDSVSGSSTSSITGYSLSNINITRHTATMDMFSVGCALVYLFTEEHAFSLSEVLTLRKLSSFEQLEERKALVNRMLDEKKRRGLLLSENNIFRKRQTTAHDDESTPMRSSDHAVMNEKELIMRRNTEAVADVQHLISWLLWASPEDRPSSSKVLQTFTPGLFPQFFGYLYDAVFPRILTKDPDGQITLWAKEFSEILTQCLHVELNIPVTEISPEYARQNGKAQLVAQQMVRLVLPPLCVAIRGASTQSAVYDSLLCVEKQMLQFIALRDKIEILLPHVLYIVQHPEEFNALGRLVGWRIITALTFSLTARLMSDASTGSVAPCALCLSDEAQERLSLAKAAPRVGMEDEDPYSRPYQVLEHATLFVSLLLPALMTAVDPSLLGSELLQDNMVILELAKECPLLLQMGEAALLWQHNKQYAITATELLEREEMTEGEKQESFQLLWQTHLSQKAALQQKGWFLFQILVNHRSRMVAEETLQRLSDWSSFFGAKKTQNNVMPYLCRLLVHKLQIFRNEKPSGKSVVVPAVILKLVTELIRAHASIQLLCDDDVNDESCRVEMRDAARKATYWHSLKLIVTQGMSQEEEPALQHATVTALTALFRSLCERRRGFIEKKKKEDENVKRSYFPLLGSTEMEEKLMQLVMLAIPLLSHSSRRVGFAVAGLLAQSAVSFQSGVSLISLCRAVRPFLLKPVPLIHLNSAVIFPSHFCNERLDPEWSVRRVLYAEGEEYHLGTRLQSHLAQRFTQLLKIVPGCWERRPNVEGLPSHTVHMPFVLSKEESQKEKVFEMRLSVSPTVELQTTAQPRSSSKNHCREPVGLISLNERLLRSLRPSSTPSAQWRVDKDAALYGIVALGNGRLFGAGSKGVAVLLRWAEERIEDAAYQSHRRAARGTSPVDTDHIAATRTESGSIRYRADQRLEVDQRFDWCEDPRVVESTSRHGQDTVLKSRNLLNEFEALHHTYTSVQCLTERPSDPLCSVTSSCDTVVLGSSTGLISTVNVEVGNSIFRSVGDRYPAGVASSSITSLLVVQPNVVLSTSSSGCIGLIDLRAAPSAMVWSTQLSITHLGVPTAACGLYNGDNAYATLIGTNAGVCQLVDLRYQVPVQNIWLHEAASSTDSLGPPAYYTVREDPWSTTTWKSRLLHSRQDWRIGQICADPLGAVAGSLSGASFPWVLLTTVAGPVIRLNVATGEVYEAFRPASCAASGSFDKLKVNSAVCSGQQRLWVSLSSSIKPSYLNPDAAIGSIGKRSGFLTVFSGGDDGGVRQWDLCDAVSACSSAHKNGALPARSSVVHCPNSFTFQMFPFHSPRYHVEVRSDYSGRTATPSRVCRTAFTSRMMEEEQGLPGKLPPSHRDAVVSLGVMAGSEFRGGFSSLSLVSASRDGVLQVWRNR